MFDDEGNPLSALDALPIASFKKPGRTTLLSLDLLVVCIERLCEKHAILKLYYIRNIRIWNGTRIYSERV